MDGNNFSTGLTPNQGDEAEIIRTADAIVAGSVEGNRLSLLEDELGNTAKDRRQKTELLAQMSALCSQGWDLRADLARMQATTLAGWQAKARVVLEFCNCSDSYAKDYDDEAVAWSLANDLLGRPSVFAPEEDGEGEEPASAPAEPAPPPPWRRSPASLGEFLALAESEFAWLGMCEKLQFHDFTTAEQAYRDEPALHDDLIAGLKAVHDRYEATHAALHRVLFSLEVGRLRATRPPEPEEEAGVSSEGGVPQSA